jgi:hypothetical protein
MAAILAIEAKCPKFLLCSPLSNKSVNDIVQYYAANIKFVIHFFCVIASEKNVRTKLFYVRENPTKYPISPPNSAEKRLERMHDLFEMIFVDHEIDEDERFLIEKYAIGLGYTEQLANKLIKRSIDIYSGGLDLEDYRYLLNKK